MFSYILLSISITAHQAMRALSVLIIAAQRQAYQPSLLSSLCFLVTLPMQSNRHRAQSWLMKSAVNALSNHGVLLACCRKESCAGVCLLVVPKVWHVDRLEWHSVQCTYRMGLFCLLAYHPASHHNIPILLMVMKRMTHPQIT